MSVVTNPKSCIDEVWNNLTETVKDLVGDAYTFFKASDGALVTENIERLKAHLSPTHKIATTRLVFYFMTNLNLHTSTLRNKQNTLGEDDVNVYNVCIHTCARQQETV